MLVGSLVNFVPALAYHFCLAMHEGFTQPGKHLLAEPCTRISSEIGTMMRDLAVWQAKAGCYCQAALLSKCLK